MTIPAGPARQGMVLFLCAVALATPAKTISGIVLSTAQGTPTIEGVAVRLIAVHPGGGEDTLRDTTLADGAFAFDNIAQECVSVRIRAWKRSFASVDTILALTTTSIDVRISLAASLMGRQRRVVVSTIVDGQGAPVPDAAIRLYALGFGSPLIFYDTTRSGGISTIDSIAEACSYCNFSVKVGDNSLDTTFQFAEDTTKVTILMPSAEGVFRRQPARTRHAPRATVLRVQDSRTVVVTHGSDNAMVKRLSTLDGRHPPRGMTRPIRR